MTNAMRFMVRYLVVLSKSLMYLDEFLPICEDVGKLLSFDGNDLVVFDGESLAERIKFSKQPGVATFLRSVSTDSVREQNQTECAIFGGDCDIRNMTPLSNEEKQKWQDVLLYSKNKFVMVNEIA